MGEEGEEQRVKQTGDTLLSPSIIESSFYFKKGDAGWYQYIGTATIDAREKWKERMKTIKAEGGIEGRQ